MACAMAFGCAAEVAKAPVERKEPIEKVKEVVSGAESTGPHARHPLTLEQAKRRVSTSALVLDPDRMIKVWTASDLELSGYASADDVALAKHAVSEAASRQRLSTLSAIEAGVRASAPQELAVAAVRAALAWYDRDPSLRDLIKVADAARAHPDRLVQYHGALMLGTMGDTTMLADLLEVVETQDEQMVLRASQSLHRMWGTKYRTQVRAGYDRLDAAQVRYYGRPAFNDPLNSLLFLLAEMDDPRAVSTLRDAVDEGRRFDGQPDPIYLLVRKYGLGESARLERMMKRDVNSRLDAIEALGRLGDPRGADLIEVARSSDVGHRTNAHWQLGLDPYTDFVVSELRAGRRVVMTSGKWRSENMDLIRQLERVQYLSPPSGR